MNPVLIAHLLGASVWTGGHLILCLALLPKILANKDVAALMAFEQQFEKVGMPALLLQMLTGLWMAHKLLPDVSMWFGFETFLDNDISILITAKLALLTLTILVALHARFRVIPTLSKESLPFFACHIVTITVLSVGFVIVGSLFRTGLG